MMSNVRWIDWKAGTPPAGGDLWRQQIA
jgi:hypothetical protein